MRALYVYAAWKPRPIEIKKVSRPRRASVAVVHAPVIQAICASLQDLGGGACAAAALSVSCSLTPSLPSFSLLVFQVRLPLPFSLSDPTPRSIEVSPVTRLDWSRLRTLTHAYILH